VVYDGERCIMCTRCVRFMDEIAKSRSSPVVDRGTHSLIATFPASPSTVSTRQHRDIAR